MALLRDSYSPTLNTKLDEARQEGLKMIIPDFAGAPDTPIAALTSAMTDAANAGKSTFEYFADIAWQPTDLEREDSLWDAFKSGVIEGLIYNNIYYSEYAIEIVAAAGSVDTQLKITFTF